MTLEELIYTRLVQEKELARAWQSMRAFRAGVFTESTGRQSPGVGSKPVPRADYLVDMTADPERHSSGMVSVNVYSDDTGKPPEELAPLVRIALCDVVMQADDGAYCITWARTELFEMNDSQNPNTLVNGCSLTFLLIAFPQQITQAPDPALAMQEFLKRWETDALVINKDHIESFYEPSDFHPAIYVRFRDEKETPDMRTHMDGVQHGHTCDRTNAGGKEQLDTVSIRHPGQTGRNYPPGRCTAAF